MSEVSTPGHNWVAIEADYRAGIKAVRQIAREHGISHTAIQKRATLEKWSRDLKAKIRAEADAKVATQAVSNVVAIGKRKVAEAVVVEAGAQLQADIRMAHRGHLTRYHKHIAKLEAELLAADLPTPEGQVKVPLPLVQRATVVKRIGDALLRGISLERQAYGIGEGDTGEDEVDIVRVMAAARARVAAMRQVDQAKAQ